MPVSSMESPVPEPNTPPEKLMCCPNGRPDVWKTGVLRISTPLLLSWGRPSWSYIFHMGTGAQKMTGLRSCLFSQPTLRHAGALSRALTWCFISFMHLKVCSYLLANSFCLANHHLKFQNVFIHFTNIDLILMTSQALSHGQEEHRIQQQWHDIQNPAVLNSLLAGWLWRMARSVCGLAAGLGPSLPLTSLLFTTPNEWVTICSPFYRCGNHCWEEQTCPRSQS